MGKRLRGFILLLCFTLFLAVFSNKGYVNSSITLRELFIGCFNTGEYFYYRDELDSLARELTGEGLIEGYDLNKVRTTTPEVWADLCSTSSRWLHFLPEEYYERLFMEETELRRGVESDQVDLMLALGTDAGTYLTQHADELSYDYMVLGSADPISAGIVNSPIERKNDRSFAVVDTKRMARQIDAAYKLFRFRSIGVVYEDKPEAYSYSGIGQLEERAEACGFTIERRFVDESRGAADDARYYRELKAAYDDLSDEVEVLYITTATIADEMLPELLENVIDHGVITVAETSESQAEYGALMHITLSDAKEEGAFAASSLKTYAAGMPITALNQVFEIAPKIILNQETIRRTGVRLPMATYLAADRIYGEKK